MRFVAESRKPDGERLEGYHDAQLRRQRFRLLSPAPVYPELEQFMLEQTLKRVARDLDPHDVFARLSLDGMSPADRAAALIQAGRSDLIGRGPKALVPPESPAERARRGSRPQAD